MLKICEDNGLVLSPTKMKIAVSTIDFLGVVIGEGTRKLQPHIIKKIVNFNEEELKTKKGLRSFLGIFNYARNHILQLGILLRPLYEKTNAHGDKRMKSSDYELVRKIKEQVQNLLDLEIPPENAYIILETDGCMEGWGGIEVTLRTDCQAIISFYNKTNSNKSSRIRWIKFADAVTGIGVKINIEHIEGKHNTLTDSLSILVNLCFAECTGEMKELATSSLHSVEKILQSPNAFQKNMKITCEEVMKISNHFQESSQKLSSHMKNQEHYTDATCSKPTKPQSEWINLMHGDQSLKTLNYQQQKKQLKLCGTYKQSYNAKPKYTLDDQPKTTTGQIKEKTFESKTRKPEESSSNWKPWHRDWDATTSNFPEDDTQKGSLKYQEKDERTLFLQEYSIQIIEVLQDTESAETNALVVLRDIRWEDSRQIIATIEVDLSAGTQLSNTSYMGFQYSVENVVDHLTTNGITAIPGERRSIEDLDGINWNLKPPEHTYDSPINTTPIEEVAATGWGEELSDEEVTPGKVTILNEAEEESDWDDDERSGGKTLVIQEKFAQNQQDFLDEYLPQLLFRLLNMSTKFGSASYNVMLITLSRTSNNGQFFLVVGLQVAAVVASFTLAFLDSLYCRIRESASITEACVVLSEISNPDFPCVVDILVLFSIIRVFMLKPISFKGEMTAALAATSIVFKDDDSYSQKLLQDAASVCLRRLKGVCISYLCAYISTGVAGVIRQKQFWKARKAILRGYFTSLGERSYESLG
nr:ORFIII-like polyprotein [Tanacetum cinerariifolium]